MYQLELFDKSEQQIRDEIKYFFDYLQTPHEAFGGMPVCPFLKSELETNKLMVEIWKPDKLSFNEVWKKFYDSDFDSAIIICLDTEGITWSDVDRKSFQKSIQKFLKKTKHKALCFSPFEEHTAAGEETRKKSPYFLINIATRDALNQAHKKLLNTKYFENFSESELKTLKVKGKK
tara:strand:+ start:657 stop:1184 length:528 start_codon:yes stop_codon:yes gene_type:complete